VRTRLSAAALAATLCGTLAAAPALAVEPEGARPQIIGGSTVASAPWAAAVSNSDGFACSGTIIAPTWVLTATHCLRGTMSVRVGNVRRANGTLRAVTGTASRYDLTLLRLARPVETTYMKLGDRTPPVGATTSLYGWGMTCFSGCGASPVLKTATARVTSTDQTDHLQGPGILSERINGNAWRGDSGGPQLYNGVQIGVASTADGTAQQLYSNVPAARSWIRTTAGV
jgi:secreted trypsin-like serine protease